MTTAASPLSADHALPLTARRPCPMCNRDESRLVHRFHITRGKVRGTFELLQCRMCELRFLDPIVVDGDLLRLYDDEFYFSTGWGYAALAEHVIEFIQGRRRRRVESQVECGRVLDVGSGDGSFVRHMARHGWQATGLEISPAAVKRAQRDGGGGRFVLSTLEHYTAPERSFDAVTMWQVFEHVPEPVASLSACRRLLRPGGALIIAVPNIDGWSSKLTGSRWWGLDIPRHLLHYTPETLSRMVSRCGFEVLSIRHLALQYDPYSLLHSSLDWCFTRRHFLSEFAKRRRFAGMGRPELAWNLAVLALLGPPLAPLSLAVTSLAASARRGGFIELHARRA